MLPLLCLEIQQHGRWAWLLMHCHCSADQATQHAYAACVHKARSMVLHELLKRQVLQTRAWHCIQSVWAKALGQAGEQS